MTTFVINLTNFCGFIQPAAEMRVDDEDDFDLDAHIKAFAKQLCETQPDVLNQGLCLATCDEQGAVRHVVPIGTVH